VILVESDFLDGTSVLSSLVGTINLARQTGSLTGYTDEKARLRARLTR
jgi:hypothetical protein